jgi:1-acyl-sn-glycerol-3-phosphate acyltransferase
MLLIGKLNNQADWGNPLTNILDGWIRVYCRGFHRQSKKLISLPKDEKLIIASNHISGLDPLVLISAVDRPIRFMIAKEEYEKPVLNWIYRAAKCIPVDRQGRVEAAFRETIKAINNYEVVGIFPQGGIHSEQTPREKLKPGLAKLSQMTQCHIQPVRISGVGAPGGDLAKAFFASSQIHLETRTLLKAEAFNDKALSQELAAWFIFSS